MKAIEKAAEAAAKATAAGYLAGDYTQDDHDGGVKRIHARIARAAVLAFLEGVDAERISGRYWISHDDVKSVLSALRAEAGGAE